MCTLSFLPADGGYHLLMNRDEQRSRPDAHPPRLHPAGEHLSVYPGEQGGGTWIGVNDAGLCAALLNWYARPLLIDRPAFSRGLIIPTLLGASGSDEAVLYLRSLPLDKLAPFRIFLFHAGETKATMLASDGASLNQCGLPWKHSHWFSSGHDEAEASRIRDETATRASAETDAGTLEWLRRLHRSHQPKRGPFSICMHREDARTVSMTEVTLLHGKAELTYHAGPPCRESNRLNLSLPFKR